MSVVIDALGIVAVIAVSITILFVLLSVYEEDMKKQLDLTAADVVSRDLSGLISISASAPSNIKINYEIKFKIAYNGKLDNRVITLSKVDEPEISERSSYAVDSISTSFSGKKSFTIKKIMENNKNKYIFEAIG